MAQRQVLANRIRQYLPLHNLAVEEKRMKGVGILNEDLMARTAPEDHEKALMKKGCWEMDFTGRPMKGFVFIAPEVTTRGRLGNTG